MLFNSWIYLLFFLPLSALVYGALRPRRHELALLWLNLCSFFFYGWWNPAYLPLLLLSITINFQLGRWLSQRADSSSGRRLLALGIALNLGLLGYFKYTDFALHNLNQLLGTPFQPSGIVLPLAISFFTFNQIAFLVDAYEGLAKEYRWNHYALFVSFFPHLLAGPIVHHRELIPQFTQPTRAPRGTWFAAALTLISFGLFKKVILADTFADYADQVFAAAGQGMAMNAVDAWLGMLSFTLQVYFDFSAYCDMAYGSALLFGIQLPQNFLSPYKSASIIDFWKRWHITLGRFITSYVYTPLLRNLPGNLTLTKGMLVTFISMTLVGLWHGAGWHYVVFGMSHGAMLVANHVWRAQSYYRRVAALPGYTTLCVALTFFLLVISLTLFRADSVDTALSLYAHAFNPQAWEWTQHLRQPVISDLARQFGVELHPLLKILPLVIAGLLWIFLLPNLQQILGEYPHALNYQPQAASRIRWQPNLCWMLLSALALSVALMGVEDTGQFVYFQF